MFKFNLAADARHDWATGKLDVAVVPVKIEGNLLVLNLLRPGPPESESPHD